MKTLKIKITGLSLNELYKKYSTGPSGFWSTDPWWENEEFANAKPEPGIYEIVTEKQLINLTYEEQKKKLKKGWDFPHPAVITEVILEHFKQTGERILEDWYTRTDTLASSGRRVCVGDFAAGGLLLGYWGGDSRNDSLGVSSAQKIQNLDPGELETSENLNLESAMKIVKDAGYKISKEY